ncbi:hypothetical protein [Amycolatopsis sp. CA-230715]|nr:hypothetical protein [Amycolatopsis sp. CA-230715]QWF85354.1 hypothetical protein HUW46_08808 [Amycolatopsis sp. CA-230715]
MGAVLLEEKNPVAAEPDFLVQQVELGLSVTDEDTDLTCWCGG